METFLWRLHESCSHHPNTRVFMGDARVDGRKDPRLHNFHEVDGCGTPSKIKGRYLVGIVFRDRDLIHLMGEVDGILGAAANEFYDSRSSGHDESANAPRLGDD